MERSRLTLFWGLMLGLSSCLRPAAAESKYRRRRCPHRAARTGLRLPALCVTERPAETSRMFSNVLFFF